MAELSYFTALANFKAIVADTPDDGDADPDLTGLTGTVTFTAAPESGDLVLATGLTAGPTGLMFAPIQGCIDSDGIMKLGYVDSNGDVQPRTTPWGAYSYTPVRLVADTATLELEEALWYNVTFSNMSYNGKFVSVNGFSFQAPNGDIEFDLIENALPGPGVDPTALTKIAPAGVRIEGDTLVFTFGGVDIPGAAKTDVVTFSRADGSATFAGTVDTPHGSSAQFALPGQLLAPRAYTSGQYFFCNSQGTTSTGNTTNNTVRVSPWLVTEAITISRLFAEFTVAGEASSEFRFGIWNDDGAGKPGTLLLDAGTASTAGSPGAFEVTVSQAVGPGIYWVGGAVQNASSTQPTMRTVNTSTMPTALPLGSSLPSTTAAGTFIQGSVTGAFSDFTASPSLSTIAARIGFKVA